MQKLREAALFLERHIELEPSRVDIRQFFEGTPSEESDMSDARGQESEQRALEIAAAGGQNVLLIGPPGTGKSMLARHGVLFLDELPEFKRSVLETMRQPLEEGAWPYHAQRGQSHFPSQFMLVAAMNPTPDGKMPHES